MTPGPQTKPYVLVVDDEFGLADLVAEMLIERGYDATIEIDGKHALASLDARPADLVLTDMMMPIMDGPELIKAMRADPRFAKIPIILMTALPEAVPAGDAQYDALLVKPFAFKELMATLHQLGVR
jgi:CheY-like chemotaxis protein